VNFISISVGPPPSRARATASRAASWTAKKSNPSTITPGMPNAPARSAMLSVATDQVLAVDSAYPLFSATKMAGRFHTDARFIDSSVVPWLLPPSPKNATLTPPVPFSFAASAVPQISGGPPPTMPLAPSMPLDRSAMCIEPPLPWQLPVVRP